MKKRYISDARAGRSLFLHVGRDVIRAPRLIRATRKGEQDGDNNNDDENANADDADAIDMDRLPPADVPEWQLFALLQVI